MGSRLGKVEGADGIDNGVAMGDCCPSAMGYEKSSLNIFTHEKKRVVVMGE
jgi:hypothetical protein